MTPKQELQQIAKYFGDAKPQTVAAKKIRTDFIAWFKNLGFVDKVVFASSTTASAKKMRNDYLVANATYSPWNARIDEIAKSFESEKNKGVKWVVNESSQSNLDTPNDVINEFLGWYHGLDRSVTTSDDANKAEGFWEHYKNSQYWSHESVADSPATSSTKKPVAKKAVAKKPAVKVHGDVVDSMVRNRFGGGNPFGWG